MSEKSIKDKVMDLGFDPTGFHNDIFDLDDQVLKHCTLRVDFSGETLEKYIYPTLRHLKSKYGVDIPISITGIDLPRLDATLDLRLREVEIQKQRR